MFPFNDFTMKDDEAKLTEEDKVKLNLAQLAGGAIGTGAGAVAGIPMDIRHQNRAVTEAKKAFTQRQTQFKEWELLHNLYRGKERLSSFPAEQQEILKSQLEANKDVLDAWKRDPYRARKELDKFKSMGDVRSMPGKDKATLKSVFPQFRGNKKAFRTRHPASPLLPGILGVVGMVGANEAVKRRLTKDTEEE